MAAASSPPRPQRSLAHLLEASAGAAAGPLLPVRSLVFDFLLALIFVAVGALLLRILSTNADADDYLFVVLINAPLALRRRFPQWAFGTSLVFGFAQMLAGVPIGFHDAGLLFALYSVVGYTNRRYGLVGLGCGALAVVVGAVTQWWNYVDRRLVPEPSPVLRVLSGLGAATLVTAAWALGERHRSGRFGVITLTERAAQLEREREQQAQLAAAAERARIAREMHDVIAHGLSVMIVQADGAAYVVEAAPEQAKEALQQISATGRESLAEMRNLLGLLRSAGSPGDRPAAQRDLEGVGELVAEAERSGAAVNRHFLGSSRPLPKMIELTAFRIIQEALTNARKHGGAAIELTVEYAVGGVRLKISNAPAGPDRSNLSGEPGHGLLGMQERVAAVGGSFRAGPATNDSFDVEVWLPDSQIPSAGSQS